MSSENNQNKDIANSLNKYSDYNNKGINAILDSANQINNCIVMKLINYQKQKNYQQGLKQMWIMIMKKMI